MGGGRACKGRAFKPGREGVLTRTCISFDTVYEPISPESFAVAAWSPICVKQGKILIVVYSPHHVMLFLFCLSLLNVCI